MKATFKNSVDVLVKAYMNDTLLHEDCSKCAVGNLCNGNRMWRYRFFTSPSASRQYLDNAGLAAVLRYGGIDQVYKMADEAIESSGYSKEQLMRIEYAFEMAEGRPEGFEGNEGSHEYQSNDTWMFNGLMAVVDVLAEIHGVDLTTKQNAIGQFEAIHATK